MGDKNFIPSDTVDRLREIDCEEVAISLGLDVRRHKTHCFLHQDHTPSLGFKRNIWKCFSCGKGGNAITLVMERMRVSFVEACVILCSLYGIPLQDRQTFSKRKLNRITRTLRDCDHTKYSGKTHFDREVAEFILHNTELTDSGKDFLYYQRKFSPSVIEDSGIHSIERGNNLLVELINHFGKVRLSDARILSSTERHLIFPTPALLIPYYDTDNSLIGLQTRYLKEIKPGQRIPKFNRICGSSIRLYNLNILNELNPGERLVIAEGITDCLALLSDGIKAAAIPSATSLPTEDLYNLRHYDLYMVPDQDNAGLSGYISLNRMMLRFGCETKRVDLPPGHKDYCEFRINQVQK